MQRFAQLRRVEDGLYQVEAIFSLSNGTSRVPVGSSDEVLSVEAPPEKSNQQLLKLFYRDGEWVEPGPIKLAKTPALAQIPIQPDPRILSHEPAPIKLERPKQADSTPIDRLREWVSSWSVPKLSICIPSQDRIDYLLPCLLSLEQTTKGYEVEVLIGDSGSSKKTFEFYRDIKIPVVKFGQPFNFSAVCNGLAAAARGEYLVFLNNDTRAITEGWPKFVLEKMEVIGCVLVHHNSPELIHHAGLEIAPHPDPKRVVPFVSGHTGYRQPMKNLDKIDLAGAIAQTGAFLYVPASIFHRLGGFDVAYRLDLQDADFCIRAREAGISVSCCPSVTFTHVSGGSRDGEQRAFPDNNWKFFSGRRGAAIRQWATQRSVSPRKERGRVLIIDDHATDPDRGFHIPRFKSILESMADLDYRVTLYQTCNPKVTQKSLDCLLMRGIEVVTDPQDAQDFAKERAGFYDTILISRPHNLARFYNTARSFFPGAQIIYDAEALFYIREKLRAKLLGINPDKAKEDERVELDMLCLADKTIAVSQVEREIIERERPIIAGKVHVWGYALPARPTPHNFHKRGGLLFTGNLNAENPNEDSIIYFVKSVWPKVRNRLGCPLAITGSNPTKRVIDLASDSVLVTGYLPADDLLHYYNGYRVFIVPTRYAAGISQKLYEAMSYGIPAVVSNIIADQLGFQSGAEVLVARTPDEFADQIIRLYSDETLWNRVRESALDFIRRTCEPNTLRKSLGRILAR